MPDPPAFAATDFDVEPMEVDLVDHEAEEDIIDTPQVQDETNSRRKTW